MDLLRELNVSLPNAQRYFAALAVVGLGRKLFDLGLRDSVILGLATWIYDPAKRLARPKFTDMYNLDNDPVPYPSEIRMSSQERPWLNTLGPL